MNSMPIRMRLTVWNCLLFGTIIAAIIMIVYYSHKQVIYKDVDLIVENVSSHVDEGITRQLNEGESFENVTILVEPLAVNDIAVILRNKQGKRIKVSGPSLLIGGPLLGELAPINDLNFQTITDQNGNRVRQMAAPVYQNQQVIGYIETLYSLKSLDLSLQRFKWKVSSLAVIGVMIASIVGWYLAKKTLWRVDLIGKTAKAIASSQDFEQRVLYIGPPDELGQLTETFNQMLDSLEKAYKNQKRFLSDASHELRAPLTTIRGNLDILHKMKNIPDIEKQEILEDIRNEAIRMSKLVSDLLSLARADSGQTSNKEVVNLSTLAVEVLDEIEVWEKEITVDAGIIENIKIWGDRDLIKQILIILLDNAIKYTPLSGSIYVRINAQKRQAVIQIKDTGIGISPEEVPMVFDRFYRSDEARKKSPEGTGLGLSIAKSIVEEHHGGIKLNSVHGEGTEFIVFLPIIE
ncbi:HAMP domain-containing histidine kinase [Mesobacillus maritimus]|uniref:sensor histidine kinase n=1 Tax=Mesobacillus maritimus TaxID=1643336 RepID=UPI00203D5B61|nr:HAMP domain-containing sensor histidine kinase [Mesobacillus maritimus]MCM3668960.1 HAMP domain-containing histidine kinase [Mesobacillus maritimus]